jgi:hypothetical protein
VVDFYVISLIMEADGLLHMTLGTPNYNEPDVFTFIIWSLVIFVSQEKN